MIFSISLLINESNYNSEPANGQTILNVCAAEEKVFFTPNKLEQYNQPMQGLIRGRSHERAGVMNGANVCDCEMTKFEKTRVRPIV